MTCSGSWPHLQKIDVKNKRSSIFRLIQGFSFGGEFGSASTWLIEGAANTKRRGFWGSWVGQSLPPGIIVGSGSVAVTTHVLPLAAL